MNSGVRGLRGLAATGGFRFISTEIRRNNQFTGSPDDLMEDGERPDSDGGFCPGNRPYFYSAGPDGDPSTVSDNVYITLPEIDELRG